MNTPTNNKMHNTNSLVQLTNYTKELLKLNISSGNGTTYSTLSEQQSQTGILQGLSDAATTHNSIVSSLLTIGSPVTTYSSFNELNFTVVSGTVDVNIGGGGNITYPYPIEVGGSILGQKLSVGDLAVSNVTIDPTNGSVLVTIKS